MNLVIFCTLCLLYCSHCAGAASTLLEDTLTYEPLTFETTLRSSWNLNNCTADLLNCYEIIKADQICSRDRHYASMCSLHRETCYHDYYKDDHRFWPYDMFEENCISWAKVSLRRVRRLFGLH